MHTVFALLCFVVVIHWLIFPYPSGLLHWHCGNLTIAPVPAKQPWWIWINTSCEFIMNDCITTTKQSTTKPCAYLLGYTVGSGRCSCYINLVIYKHMPTINILNSTGKKSSYERHRRPFVIGDWLLPDGTKPLPEPMLIEISVVTYIQQGLIGCLRLTRPFNCP